MIEINLSDKSKSHLDYTIIQRSDGQQDVVINTKDIKLSGITDTGKSWSLGVTIKSRFNSFRDLELMIGATKSLRKLGIEEIHLYIPYLLGARGDRKFESGGNAYLVDVLAPVINLQGYKSVTVIDAHSDVASACINNLIVLDNAQVVKRALTLLTLLSVAEGAPIHIFDKLVLLSPDAGALKKVYHVIKEFKFPGDVIVASKHRDIKSGDILATTVPYKNEYSDKTIVIIDDICDGGRTFIEIAKAIKADSKHQGKVVLVITHGIFSYGIKPLSGLFDLVVTTNSVKNKDEMIVGESEVNTDFLQVVEVI